MLITTFGMVAMGVAGIAGAVLTMYVGSSHAPAWLFGLALAELALALAVIQLIARRDHLTPRWRLRRKGERKRG